MDAILEIIKDDTGLSVTFYFVLLLLVGAKGIVFTRQLKTATIYAVIYLLLLTKQIDWGHGVGVLFATLFILNEFLVADQCKIKLFNLWEKLVDFIYKAFIEDHIGLVCISLLLLSPHGIKNYYDSIMMYASVPFIVSAIVSVIRSHYSTKTITEIVATLNKQNIYEGDGVFSRKELILLAMEDSTFIERKGHSHNMLAFCIVRKLRRYLKKRHLLNLWGSFHNFFSRGYATIEMQLIRSVGIRNGFDKHIYRRKIFEVIYSDLLFNALKREANVNNERFREWIIRNYIYNVRVKVYGKVFLPFDDNTTFKQLFKKDYNKISNEQFFIWCIGLTHISNIGPRTIRRRLDVIQQFGLSLDKIRKELEKNSPNWQKYDWSELYKIDT